MSNDRSYDPSGSATSISWKGCRSRERKNQRDIPRRVCKRRHGPCLTTRPSRNRVIALFVINVCVSVVECLFHEESFSVNERALSKNRLTIDEQHLIPLMQRQTPTRKVLDCVRNRKRRRQRRCRFTGSEGRSTRQRTLGSSFTVATGEAAEELFEIVKSKGGALT